MRGLKPRQANPKRFPFQRLLSELGLAQSEDSFQLKFDDKTQDKRTVISRVDCLLETGVSISRQENVREGERKL
jgi:hypothetical protein